MVLFCNGELDRFSYVNLIEIMRNSNVREVFQLFSVDVAYSSSSSVLPSGIWSVLVKLSYENTKNSKE